MPVRLNISDKNKEKKIGKDNNTQAELRNRSEEVIRINLEKMRILEERIKEEQEKRDKTKEELKTISLSLSKQEVADYQKKIDELRKEHEDYKKEVEKTDSLKNQIINKIERVDPDILHFQDKLKQISELVDTIDKNKNTTVESVPDDLQPPKLIRQKGHINTPLKIKLTKRFNQTNTKSVSNTMKKNEVPRWK